MENVKEKRNLFFFFPSTSNVPENNVSLFSDMQVKEKKKNK